jgi:hypothetical protein
MSRSAKGLARLNTQPFRMAGLFLAARLILLSALSLEGLRGYGDYVHFFRLAGMGIPFIDYWVEFPPVFPFLSLLMFRLANGQEHIYDQMLALVLSLFQAGEVAVLTNLVHRIYPAEQAQRRAWKYLIFVLALAYGWWYFDPLASFFVLFGVFLALQNRHALAGMALGLGALTKFFPLLALPALWRWAPARRNVVIALAAIGLTVAVYGALWKLSPEMTQASIISQGGKGSWETVWALLDGNFRTGNFGPEQERYNPALAATQRGNPAVLPAWATLPIFAGLGGWVFAKAQVKSLRQLSAFLGITWCIFLLWMPGWSPQWVLYLLPIMWLVLPEKEALLFSLTLVIVNLLEWPVLLSRGYVWSLWLTVPLRSFLFVLLIWEHWKVLKHSE